VVTPALPHLVCPKGCTDEEHQALGYTLHDWRGLQKPNTLPSGM
jgi:hypothetical protein